MAQAERLWNELARLKADRKTVIVAVGGGVVGDLAGFVAATYGRGLAFMQIPTTLLAQVDSSVGGKVGINLPAAKNIVGAFWQPAGVLIDLDVLSTLPDREYRSGLAEVVKYGVILDADFFAYLEQNADALIARDPHVLEHIVAQSCRLKADVVEQDEREETGLRAVLELRPHLLPRDRNGHRLRPLPARRGGRDRHGLCFHDWPNRLGESMPRSPRRQRNLLQRLGLPTEIQGLDPEALLSSHAARQEGRARATCDSCFPPTWATWNWLATLIVGTYSMHCSRKRPNSASSPVCY